MHGHGEIRDFNSFDVGEGVAMSNPRLGGPDRPHPHDQWCFCRVREDAPFGTYERVEFHYFED